MHTLTGALSSAVDMYNSVTGAWTTAQLSVARSSLAATSVGNMALFAGGITGTLESSASEGELLMFFPEVFLCLACVVLWLSFCLPWEMQMCSHARLCRCSA
jgi:hypothetical protein